MITIVVSIILCISVSAILYALLCDIQFKGKITRGSYYMFWLVIASVCVHFICAFLFTGHSYDMSCYRIWASRLANDGFMKFYASGEFNNYPPGYMYILWIIGMINKPIGLSEEAVNLLLKIPPMLIDILLGVFIYRFSSKRNSFRISYILAALWLFNPAAITDSALWGQTDVVFAIVIVLMLYFIAEEKLPIAYFMFAAAILIKPQSFVLTPVLICAIIEQVFLRGFDVKVFIKNICAGILAIASMLVLCLPFGISNVIAQYQETLKGNIYFTQNAFNIWGMLGKNYSQITFNGIVCGYILLGLSVIFTSWIFFKAKGKEKVYFCGGLLTLCTFMLSAKMNERYAFVVIPCFLMAYAAKPIKGNIITGMLITLSQFFNLAWVLFVFETDPSGYFFDKWIMLYSAINVEFFAYVIYVAFAIYARDHASKKK